MSQKTEEFKEFVKQHPGLKKLVYDEHKSWQSIFEEWSLFGNTDVWDKYRNDDVILDSQPQNSTSTAPVNKEVAQIGNMLKSCVNYVKKINPDSLTKTITNIQKLMALVAGLGAANTANAAMKTKKTGDPLFDQRFDEWY